MNNLSMLAGKPTELEFNLKVYPVKLQEIVEIGDETYNSYIATLFISKKSLDLENTPKEELDRISKISEFEFVLITMHFQPEIKESLLGCLSLFLKEEVFFDEENGLHIRRKDGLVEIDETLFSSIKQIIAAQNYLNVEEEKSKFNPATEKAKLLVEKMNQIKAKVKKENKENGLSLKDIVSIVATYSNDINLLTVWDLTVYQLYEAYMRLIIWDNYHTNFSLMPHITDHDSLDLKHWASDIKL